MTNKTLLLSALCTLSVHFAFAATLYVDNTIGNDSYDGKSATVVSETSGPKRRIQMAIDAAADGDTIKIAAGVYGDDQGFTPCDGNFNNMRVKVNKNVTIEGAGRDKTFIKGALDKDKGVDKGYCGKKSVGGVLFTQSGANSVLKSVCICECSESLRSDLGSSAGIALRWSGAATTSITTVRPWVVDCIISNIFFCTMPCHNLNFARSMICKTYGVRHTDAVKSGEASAFTQCNAIHSVFAECGDIPREASSYDNYCTDASTPISVQGCDYIVNCVWSRVMNAATPGSKNVKNIFNCIQVDGGYANSSIRGSTVKDCFLTGDPTADVTDNNKKGNNGYVKNALAYDFHPVARDADHSIAPAETAVGLAHASNMDVFPEEYRWTDFYGHEFEADENGMICAGCSQEPVVPVAAFKADGVVVDGASTYCKHRNNNLPSWVYVTADEYPKAFELDWDRDYYKQYKDVFHYEVGDGSMVKVPNREDKALFVPRREVRGGSVKAQFAGKTYYVSPDGNDSAAGTEAAPFQTIQKAVNMSGTTYGERTLVKVMPGDYTTGGAGNNNGSCRVLIGSARKDAMIAIRSTGGAEVTRIIGAPAPEDKRDQYGFGESATRCVGFFGAQTNSYIQGFTLMNGYCSSTSDGTASGVHAEGGAGRYPFVAVADCIISNCYGSTSHGVLQGVRAVRCKIVDCYNYNNYLVPASSHLINSLVDGVYDLKPASGKNNVLLPCPIQGCTILSRDANSMIIPSGHEYMFDTIISGKRDFGDSNNLFLGMVFGEGFFARTDRYPEGVCRRTVADSGFVNAKAGDYHLVNDSAAIEWGVWGRLPGYDYDTPDPIHCGDGQDRSVSATYARTRYYDNITYDMDGNKPIMVKGKGVSGCYQTPVAARATCKINVPSGVTVTGVPANGLVPFGGSAEITLENGTRQIVSVKNNGVLTDARTFTLNPTAYDPNTTDWKQVLNLDITVNTDWYVDATGGSDTEGDGWTEATAFKTLAKVMPLTLSGDKVTALPGTYNEGTQVPPIGILPTRAVIPLGVKLVSRDGFKTTVIEGVNGPKAIIGKTNVECRGEDPNNIRCVFMTTNSYLEGFTLKRGGVLDTDSKSVGTDQCGGGIYVAAECPNYQKPLAMTRNCRIEFCTGAIYHGGYERCMIISNAASSAMGVMTQIQYLENCILAENRGVTCLNQLQEVINCTFSDNKNLAGTGVANAIATDPGSADWHYVNCIFHESPGWHMPDEYTNAVRHVWNSIVPREGYFRSAKETDYKNITVIPELKLDENYRPIDLDTAVIDTVTNAWATAYPLYAPADRDTTIDIWGGQRVYNGICDLGAVEHDWRPDYAKILRAGAIQVTAASPEVVAVEGGVKIPAGAELAAAYTSAKQQGGKFAVTLDGADLAFTLNGAATQATEGENKFTLTEGANTLSFAATGSGSATLTALKRDAGFVFLLR